ncbi:uncharacterized protein F5891DRAFT_976773 [Suillus fuscotomentosus]|uniref:Uncharacterized protein n=1 Tax=Suillus fuscotomentosus TaxID=1912939 RepID=A0AAD4HQ06_9AGAM|nr:uncharacterized protein F5891DRAFT_976773 [Suillus fuscotomentosus]KAG1904557.1 hypothetical protein F5891DRAFT_976773 [Suillus fuscotomentosus]
MSDPLPGPQVVQSSLQMPPTAHIKIIHHLHSNITKPAIIPLKSSLDSELKPESRTLQPIIVESVPWTPFRNIQDFEYMEIAVQACLTKSNVNARLYGLQNGWAKGSWITLENHRDMEQALTASHAYIIPLKCVVHAKFQEGIVSVVEEEWEVG